VVLKPAGERVARKGLGEPRYDLAIIKTDFKMSNPARFDDSAEPSPATGAAISIDGYRSLGRVVIKTKMTLGRVKPASKNARGSFITMAVDVRSGNSGRPVLDASGRAIGVAIPLGPVRRGAENNRVKLLTVDRPEALSDKACLALARDFVVQVRCWGKK
jgi:hypothetical protein